MTTSAPADLHPLRVWDLPTRAFHWLLTLAVLGSVLSAKLGGNAMVWHFRFGYVVLALLAFRLVWGLVGGHWSRFSSFIYSPVTLWRYLRGRLPRAPLEVGHSPLAALSVWALLGVLALQLATGLVADDEIANVGPLSRFVSLDLARDATRWHKGWGQWLVLGLIGLHLLAVAVYQWVKKKDLLRPMWHGDKRLPRTAPPTPASADGWPQWLLALGLAAAAAGLAAWVASLALSGF